MYMYLYETFVSSTLNEITWLQQNTVCALYIHKNLQSHRPPSSAPATLQFLIRATHPEPISVDQTLALRTVAGVRAALRLPFVL